MRTYGLASKVVLAVGSALGLLLTMREPWYGPRPAPTPDASVGLEHSFDAGAAALTRWFSDPLGTSAWQAFGYADVLLAGLALAAGFAALACLQPEGEQAARLILQLAALSACALLALKFVDHPGDNGMAEPRYGLFVAVGLVVTLLVSATGINACPLRRRSAPMPYGITPR